MASIQELQAAVLRLRAQGLSPEDLLRELGKEFPGVTAEEALAAFDALDEEVAYQLEDLKSEKAGAERVVQLIRKAREESGNGTLNTGEALTYLAERGDREAQAFLDELTDPQNEALYAEFRAAVEWHPKWHWESDLAYCDEGTELGTPEKLLAAYRKFRAN